MPIDAPSPDLDQRQLAHQLSGPDLRHGLVAVTVGLEDTDASGDHDVGGIRRVTLAEQEERQRISQILHDDLQQSLFAIKTQLKILMDDDELRVSDGLKSEL